MRLPASLELVFDVNYFCRFRRLFLPVHLLLLTSLLSHTGSVAGYVEFQDDRVMHDAVDGHHNQGVALSQSGVQRVPAPSAVGAGGSEDADVLIDVRKCHAGGQQLLALGFRVAARQLGDSGAAAADVAVCLGIALPPTGADCAIPLWPTPEQAEGRELCPSVTNARL